MDNKKIYILIETWEDDDIIREFNVVATSFDVGKLQKIMKDLIEKDVYGFIEKNGVSNDSSYNFTTNYEDGFMEYDIISDDII